MEGCLQGWFIRTSVIPLSDVLLLSSLFCDSPHAGFILSSSAYGWVAASGDWLLASLFTLSGREREKHYFCLLLKSENKFSEDPIKFLLMSYWPELGPMLISETITHKKHGIILIPVCLNLNLKVEVVSLRYIGYVELKKRSLGYIRKKEYDNFWIGSQECYCIALKINPWH